MKCCHPDALIHCPHPCRYCRHDKAVQLSEEIGRYERQSARDEEMDTGRALELLRDARLLLRKIGKEA